MHMAGANITLLLVHSLLTEITYVMNRISLAIGIKLAREDSGALARGFGRR